MKTSSRIVALLTTLTAGAVVAGCSGAAESLGSSAARISVDCSPATAWAENVSYATGALVSYDGTVYQCIQGHTSEAGWTPAAVPALWEPVSCSSGTASGSSGSGSSSNGGSSSSGGSTTSGGSTSSGSSGSGASCDPNAWVYLGANENACDGNIGEQCGWTTSNGSQGYHCAATSWGTGCEPGGTTCPGGGSTSGGVSSGGSASGGTTSTGGTASGGGGLAAILSESQLDAIFPNRLAIYGYAGLVGAAQTYAAFATTGSLQDEQREVAAFLANAAHETIGFQYVNEIAQAVYCSPTAACPCAAGQEYFGRGALQLSWSYNYCAAGQALGQDLLNNPGLVATDSSLAWGTGVWFWMTDTGAGSETPHNAIVAGSFGGTIQAINGSIECNGGDPSEVADRVQYYQTICAALGVDPGSGLGC